MTQTHELTLESFNTLKQMLESQDERDIDLAIEILNNCDLSDSKTMQFVNELFKDSTIPLSIGDDFDGVLVDQSMNITLMNYLEIVQKEIKYKFIKTIF